MQTEQIYGEIVKEVSRQAIRQFLQQLDKSEYPEYLSNIDPSLLNVIRDLFAEKEDTQVGLSEVFANPKTVLSTFLVSLIETADCEQLYKNWYQRIRSYVYTESRNYRYRVWKNSSKTISLTAINREIPADDNPLSNVLKNEEQETQRKKFNVIHSALNSKKQSIINGENHA